MAKESVLIKSIPCAPHIRQYFISEYGAEPIQAHQKSFIGTAILCVAQKMPYRILAEKNQPADCALLVQLPTALKHYTITNDAAKNLGKHLEKEFQRNLIMFVKGQVAVTQNELHAIKMFYEHYQIDSETYDFDAARKIWRDYKDRLLNTLAKNADKIGRRLSKAA